MRSFFRRLRVAWRFLWGKGPIYTELPEDLSVGASLMPFRIAAHWWCPADRVLWAKENLTEELCKNAREYVRFNVEEHEDSRSATVCGELWILREEHHGESENKS